MRLGVIYEPGSVNSYYRAVVPMRALERRGHTVVWPTRVEELPMRAFLTCDLVHCYRRMDRLGDLRRLAARGVTISFDNDDDFAAAETGEHGKDLAGLRRNKRLSREALAAAKLADLVTTPSAVLAERYRVAGVEKVEVIENHLEREMLGFGSRSPHEGLVLGWVAGREHMLDLDRVPIVAALERLLEVHAGVRVRTVGVRLPLASERYEHVLEVDFPNLLTSIASIDIGLAPLADTAFNRARSSVKLKEYSSAGAMWLASPVGPYLELGESQGGRLVADRDWFSTLDELVRRRRTRRRLARRALRWARTQTVDRHAHRWESAFLQAIDRTQQTSTPSFSR